MRKLSLRCARLRDDAVHVKSWNEQIACQRTMLLEESLYEHKDRKKYSRLAAAIYHVADKAPAFIRDGELLVGYNFADTPYPEFYSPSDSEEDRQLVLNSGFTEEQYRNYLLHHGEVLGLYQFDRHAWDFNATHDPRIAEIFSAVRTLTQADLELDEEWAAIGRCMSDNHSVIGYEQVVKKGFLGLKAEVEGAEAENGESDFYEGLKIVCDAGCVLAERYADCAAALAAKETDETRKRELLSIEAVCRRVPAHPAETLHEAMQSLVFAHILNTWEDNINANSLGRLDQILFPYYEHDIREGILTEDEAFELVCCLWLKFYRDYDVQQSCVGGCKADGSDAVNALSYLMLDATESLNFIRCMSVRYNAHTDPAFLSRALEVVGHVGKGVPFFFNDDVMIPALMSKGVPLEDARGYTQIGCVETVLPGISNPHAVSGETNLLKALEYVFGNGHSLFDPAKKPGLETGPLDSFPTYESFYDAVMRQADNIVRVSCRKVHMWIAPAAEFNPKPVKSLLTADCIKNGRDFNDHGPRYDYYQIMLGGVPNLADSLMVVKTLVYDQRKYTLEEMAYQLREDFPDEAFRQECLHKCPKFGNDIDCVDRLAAAIIDRECDVLDEMDEVYGVKFHAQPFTFLWMVDHGRVSAASPDGRRKGEVIAYSMSPMQGRDFNGFTALLNSIAKMPGKRCPGTVSAIVEVDPKLFTDENIPVFADILLAAAEKGLSNVQFNTVDTDTLKDAQLHPDKYNNLAVRVSGFSQKFNLLDKALQDHIIARTKHQCL